MFIPHFKFTWIILSARFFFFFFFTSEAAGCKPSDIVEFGAPVWSVWSVFVCLWVSTGTPPLLQSTELALPAVSSMWQPELAHCLFPPHFILFFHPTLRIGHSIPRPQLCVFLLGRKGRRWSSLSWATGTMNTISCSKVNSGQPHSPALGGGVTA